MPGRYFTFKVWKVSVTAPWPTVLPHAICLCLQTVAISIRMMAGSGHLTSNFEVRMDMKADGLTHEIFQQGIDSLSGCMAGLFRDKSTTDYKNNLPRQEKGVTAISWLKNITYPQLLQLKAFPIFRYGQYKGGLIVLQSNKRTYPYKELANRTIGYMRDATVQPVGLEGAFNNQLTGIPGKD